MTEMLTEKTPLIGVRKPSEYVTSDDWWAVWIGVLFIPFIIAHSLFTFSPSPKCWHKSPIEMVTLETICELIFNTLGFMVSVFIAAIWMQKDGKRFRIGLVYLTFIGFLVRLINSQCTVQEWQFGVTGWAIVIGMIIGNACGNATLKDAALTEFYIKVSVVLVGINFKSLIKYGLSGLAVAWIDTPIVLICMYVVGTRFLQDKV